MAKTQLRLRNDVRVLKMGTSDEVERLLAGYQNLPGVRDRDGWSIKQHLLLRSDLDVLPLLDRLGLGLTPDDLDDATRISGPLLLVRLKAFQHLGVNLAQTLENGDTLLHQMVRNFGPDTPPLLEFLLSAGLPVTVRNAESDTLLHLLVSKMNDHRMNNLSVLFGPQGPALFGLAMATVGMAQEARQAVDDDDTLRALQEAWVERFIAAGLSPFDTNRHGMSVFDHVPRRPGGFDRMFERRDAGYPARTEAERRVEEHSPDNIRLIGRMETLAGRAYVCTKKEDVLSDLKVALRNPDGSYSPL